VATLCVGLFGGGAVANASGLRAKPQPVD